MNAFGHLFLAHTREFVRDRMALFWTFAFVVFFALMFGLAVGYSWEPAIRVAVVSDNGGAIARRLVAELRRIDVFDVVEASPSDGDTLWQNGSVQALVAVTDEAAAATERGVAAPISITYDAADRRLRALTPVVNAALSRAIGTPDEGSRLVSSAIARRRPGPRAVDLFVPGVLTMLLMQLGLFGASMPMISLRVQGVLRRLRATPLPPLVIVAAPIAVRLVIVALQMAVITAVARLVFGVTLQRTGVAAVGMAALGTASFIAVGLLIAATARTVESGNVLASALQVPMLFLSGILFPIDAAPAFLRPAMSIWPTTHLGDALRQTMVGAQPVYGLTANTMVLAAWLFGAGALAVRAIAVERQW